MGEVGFVILMLGIIYFGFNQHQESTTSIEYAKAGLQQCVVDNKVVWQKECK